MIPPNNKRKLPANNQNPKRNPLIECFTEKTKQVYARLYDLKILTEKQHF